jgi:starch-binding outer membrane protein, SusD/RagB family
MRTRRFAVMAALLVLGACNFDILNTNEPTLDDLLQSPTRSKLQFFGSGLFAQERQDIQNFIWRVGSMGREGINLSGNNQPDFIEPYFGPVQGGGSFGDTQWATPYIEIRDANVFLAALAKTPDIAVDPVHGVAAGEKAGARAIANTLKALAFMYVIETRAQLGAPVAVDLAITAAPAPFVHEDSVYKYIVALLDSGAADLGRVGIDTVFLVSLPPGFALFATPKTFLGFNRALAAKANVLRATDETGCAGNRTTCYTTALSALTAAVAASFPSYATAANFPLGAFYDFGTGSGDALNTMSEPLNALTFFALQDNIADADTQAVPGHLTDRRVLSKIAAAQDTQRALLGSIPIPGQLKFTVYMTNGAADPTHPIPIIRAEELALLDAEAQWFTGNHAQALMDLNNVRMNSGNVGPDTVSTGSPDSNFVKALMKQRRYSLLWEQGTRWIDARRFGRLSDIPTDIPATFPNPTNPTPGHVPPEMPVPQSECNARNLTASAIASGEVVTCQPPLM